ncbi:MAG: 5-formyltetrahydrofolate cyclo-ligase [Gammaproteobacteria bacterium]|nr:5-formyltetrahydrofolate cyclo-ligase [Gammaproteobacteria bacterium]
MTHSSRSTLRKYYRHQRRSLRPGQRLLATQRIEHLLGTCPEFLSADAIVVYLASDGEVELQTVIERAWQLGKKIFVPVVDNNNQMTFVPLRSTDRMISGKWGIKTPARSARSRARAPFSLVLAPLVAFDASGNRLGRGGGHYDRFFAQFTINKDFTRKASPAARHASGTAPANNSSSASNWRQRPFIMGVAHSCQQAPALPAKPWDIALDAVVTERGIRYFR